jgi:hypothetical protein
MPKHTLFMELELKKDDILINQDDTQIGVSSETAGVPFPENKSGQIPSGVNVLVVYLMELNPPTIPRLYRSKTYINIYNQIPAGCEFKIDVPIWRWCRQGRQRCRRGQQRDSIHPFPSKRLDQGTHNTRSCHYVGAECSPDTKQ